MESAVWYYVVNGAQVGPVSLDELKTAAATGKLAPADLVWKEGTADWVPARTVPELFPATPPPLPKPAMPPVPPPPPPGPPQPTYSLSPPPPPAPPHPAGAAPAPAPAGQQPLSLDDDRGQKQSGPYDLPAPSSVPKPQPEWVKLIPVFLRRTFNPDAVRIAPVPDEETALTRSGMMDLTARKFAVWRRAVLFVAAVPLAFAALFGLIAVIAQDKDAFSGFGAFVLYIQALALFAVPAAAVFAALAYDRFAVSAKWVLLGALVSLAVPLAVGFTPADWLHERRASAGAAFGGMISISLMILPALMALSLALAWACVRMKQLLPESPVPGWGLMTAVPLCALLTLTAFVPLYHLGGNVLLFVALLVWIGAPLLYLSKLNLFTRPAAAPADQTAIVRASVTVLILVGAGVVLFIIYLFTSKVLGFDSESSAIRPWNLSLHQKWLEYLGRVLFLSVFVADLIVRIALVVWREERAFAGTPDAAGFDRTMSGLGSATLPRGSTPPPTA